MTDSGFRRLLRLYPPSFRREFGAEMVDTFLRERQTSGGGVRFHVTVFWDIVITAAAAWVRLATHGDARPRPEWESRNMFERWSQDLRYALRTLLGRPVFTSVVVATLALGIGANTAIFTLVNEIVVRPLPIGAAHEVVDIFADTPGGNSFTGFSYPDFEDYRDRNDVLDGLAILTGRTLLVGSEAASERVRVQFSSANYFDVLQVKPPLGRSFRPEEDVRARDNRVAVVSHAFWQRHGGDAAFLGSTVLLNGQPFTVIGVLPEGFEGTFIGFPMEIWVPMAAGELVLTNFDLADRGPQGFELIGRRRPGISTERVAESLAAIAEQLESEHPVEGQARGIGVVPTTGVDHSMRFGVMSFLAILMSVTGLVLLITCLNVGGLLLARATTRRREMAIRLAMGAGRGRLVRQLLTEVGVLFAAAALVAGLLAHQLTEVLHTFVAAADLPIAFSMAVDWRVLLFTLLVSFATALIAGTFPASEAVREEPMRVLRTAGGDDAGRTGRLRGAFVVTQIAAAVILLTGAGLFIRSLQQGLALDPGFDADRVAVASIQLPAEEYDEERGRQFFDELRRRVEQIPGVEAASIARRPPIGVGLSPVGVEIAGFETRPDDPPLMIDANSVHAGYLRTVGIEILSGRGLRPSDDLGAAVALVNRTMAERFWPHTDPVGELIHVNGEPTRVVGVAADSRTLIQESAPRAHLYLPIGRRYDPGAQLLVRSAARPGTLRGPIEEQIRTLDANLAAAELELLRDRIDSALLPQRAAALITGSLGGFGLLLASLGIYATLAQAVSRRRREIGIRMALGSDRSRVQRLVMAGGLKLVVSGLAAGLAGSLAVAPLLGSFLVGVRPADPATLAAVTLLFLTIAAAACWLPARRAARIDPIRTLKEG